ncbi:MAG TPA: valine--tRNA ligase [Bacteroidales bacterium]|nr:valine--tRNA ligase [Bacteroidales bacterium]
MDLASKYDPNIVEDKWYAFWLEHKFFHSEPDGREPFTIVIPPPNVTGVLHMGHMLNNTIQDILVRRARMQGKNAEWLPGTDHASIATEAKVVGMLREKGIAKKDISREEFLKYAWQWKEKHGGIILEQLKKLGASCDWDRTCFTMDEARYESVMKVFIDLYEKGLIYRGVRMVNWDPKALTAVSDEEVIYKEVDSKLYYVRYKVEGTADDWIVIATTRPETILGDTAVCVHPDDERYSALKGKNVLVPLINRPVPMIFDEYVDREFGTGALKVTPAHDINDYNLGLKYNLEIVDTFNPDGTMSEAAQLYIGEDRFAVRKKITKDLQEKGHIVKIENYKNKVGYSQRTDEVIEPRISLQWFLKMKELAKPALDLVENDTIRFYPAKYKNMYRNWMENVTDWCISRQLWWGHRIPAYYLPDGKIVVAASKEEAVQKANSGSRITEYGIQDIRQDEDVLDTWFSSWLWPISVFDGIRFPENQDINFYYPTSVLITAPDIIFFWVARMIMAGWEYRKDIPFKDVYFTGMVRDRQGRKMSKSLGNSPEPLELIANYGADAVRVGMLLCSPAGNDLLFDESLIEQGRNFCNKIWNALRLVKGWEVDTKLVQPEDHRISIRWFNSVLADALRQNEELFGKYRLSEILMNLYKLVWDDFCSWYLEMIKPGFQQPVDATTYETTLGFFEKLVNLLHPFMPFITEEIWHLLRDRDAKDSILFAPVPGIPESEPELITKFAFAEEVIMAIRNVRKERNIPFREPIRVLIRKNLGEKPDTTFDGVASRLCNITELGYTEEKIPGALSFIVRTTEFYIPLKAKVDASEEIRKLEDELEYTRGFLKMVEQKLGNKKFTDSAPEKVVQSERKKKSDAEARIRVLEEQIKMLSKK